jgi:hypothetical protein
MNDYCIVIRPERIIAASQAWFWDARWQEGQREANRDIAERRSRKHPVRRGLVTIAGKPSDELAAGTWNSILKQAGLKDEEST